MKYIICSFLVAMLIFSSCHQSVDSFKLAENFYNSAKEKESEIDFFHKIYVQARGIDPNDSIYRITKIDLKINDSTTITLPGIKNYMTEEQIESLPFNENVMEFGKLNNLTPKQSKDSVRTLSLKVIGLMSELKAYKIVGNPQGVGHFIIFSVTSEYDVIYVPDTSKVSHEYWKIFFQSDNKFDKYWYYRKN